MTDRGYFTTPNTSIPLNDRAPGEIADIALRQLQPYQEAAKTWPILHTTRDGRSVNLCRECYENIWFDSDKHDVPYTYTEEEIQTLIVAHIRQNHERMIGGQEATARSEMSLQDMQE
jgi:hypothetical protein